MSVIENNNDVDIIDFKAIAFTDNGKIISKINEKFEEGLYIGNTLDPYLKMFLKSAHGSHG